VTLGSLNVLSQIVSNVFVVAFILNFQELRKVLALFDEVRNLLKLRESVIGVVQDQLLEHLLEVLDQVRARRAALAAAEYLVKVSKVDVLLV